MPVTARLSKAFYDRLGEEIANELVDWFNQVDATYRGDLREINELNFARFDAKLEQRVAALEAKLEQRVAALEAKLEQRLTELRVLIDSKLDRTAAEQAFAQLNTKIDQVSSGLEARLERRLGEQTRWLLGAWAVVLASIIGLWLRG